jgi:hypothetical protein
MGKYGLAHIKKERTNSQRSCRSQLVDAEAQIYLCPIFLKIINSNTT